MVVDGNGRTHKRRPIWLVLQGDAPAFGLDDLVGPRMRVRIVADPVSIAALLRRERPRLAIIEVRPGGEHQGGAEVFAARLDALATASARRPRAALVGAILPVAKGFELDVASHELRQDGRIVHLRPKEFQLLVTLATNPGRAFTRDRLIELAWNSHRDVDPRTIDVHVHWLRMKIESQPRRPTHLMTIRGFGYRLDPEAR